MTQMNEMSARALTMEELENVNGGVRITKINDIAYYPEELAFKGIGFFYGVTSVRVIAV